MQHIQENGEENLEMVKEFKSGLTEQNIQVIGHITKLRGKGNLFIKMEIFMKVNGQIIMLAATVFIKV